MVCWWLGWHLDEEDTPAKEAHTDEISICQNEADLIDQCYSFLSIVET